MFLVLDSNTFQHLDQFKTDSMILEVGKIHLHSNYKSLTEVEAINGHLDSFRAREAVAKNCLLYEWEKKLTLELIVVFFPNCFMF